MAKKSVLKEIKKRADRLPVIITTFTEKHLVKGHDLLDQGMNEFNSLPIVPNAVYLQDMLVRSEINHYRRMKRAYEQSGVDGIGQYIDSVEKIVEQRKAEQ